jgi:hypothetical protein
VRQPVGFFWSGEGENPSFGQKSRRGRRGGASRLNSATMLSPWRWPFKVSMLAAKFAKKNWPGIERCIKLSSGLYGIHSAAIGVKGL